MYLRLATLHVIIATCQGMANYDLFRGFNDVDQILDDDTTNLTTPLTIIDELTRNLLAGEHTDQETIDPKTKSGKLTTTLKNAVEVTTLSTPITNSAATVLAKVSKRDRKTTVSVHTSPRTMVPVTTSKRPFTDKHTIVERNFDCKEEERPSNLGAYEIPTQRDLVLYTRKALLRMFDNYHKKTLIFLKDIKEVMKSTANEERKCVGVRKILYRQCVRQVSGEFEQHTKKLVNYLEQQRREVMALTEGTICRMSDMRADPVRLMKSLAAEEVSLQYALPGFLRLLSSCSKSCVVAAETVTWNWHRKPSREHSEEQFHTYRVTKNVYLNRIIKPRHKIIL